MGLRNDAAVLAEEFVYLEEELCAAGRLKLSLLSEMHGVLCCLVWTCTPLKDETPTPLGHYPTMRL